MKQLIWLEGLQFGPSSLSASAQYPPGAGGDSPDPLGPQPPAQEPSLLETRI